MASEGNALRNTILGVVLGGLIGALLHGEAGATDMPWAALERAAASLTALQEPEFPLSKLFLLFLLAFVLLGLIPGVQKLVSWLEKFLTTLAELPEPGGAGEEREREAMVTEAYAPVQLYDMEVLVLAQLARAGRRGLTLRRLAGELHLAKSIVAQTAQALRTKGLVLLVKTYVLGTRCHLSRRGREYALRQGFLPGPRHRSWGKGP